MTGAALCSPPRSRVEIALPATVGALVAAASLAFYVELAEDMRISPAVYAFDQRLTAVIQAWRVPVLTALFRAVTWSASPVPVALVTIAAVAVLLWLARFRDALCIALVVALGTGIGTIAKQVTARPRPPATSALVGLPTSYSFPSGHTLAAILLWTMIAFAVLRVSQQEWLRWTVTVGGMVITVLVGTSRVYLGVHWPSDVLASWLLGAAWLSLVLGTFVTWERWMATRR